VVPQSSNILIFHFLSIGQQLTTSNRKELLYQNKDVSYPTLWTRRLVNNVFLAQIHFLEVETWDLSLLKGDKNDYLTKPLVFELTSLVYIYTSDTFCHFQVRCLE